MATWNIHEADGRYVGQHTSASATMAFCDYMALYEPGAKETEVQLAQMEDGTLQLEYGSRQFVLSELS